MKIQNYCESGTVTSRVSAVFSLSDTDLNFECSENSDDSSSLAAIIVLPHILVDCPIGEQAGLPSPVGGDIEVRRDDEPPATPAAILDMGLEDQVGCKVEQVNRHDALEQQLTGCSQRI